MQLAMHMVTIEDLMPQEHLLRKAGDGAGFVVCVRGNSPALQQKYGCPAIDPVVIVKYLLVGFLYGIPSERQIERRIQTDIALRWYLGLDSLRPGAGSQHHLAAAPPETVLPQGISAII